MIFAELGVHRVKLAISSCLINIELLLHVDFATSKQFKTCQSNPYESAKADAANCYRQYHFKFHFVQCLFNVKCIDSPEWRLDPGIPACN